MTTSFSLSIKKSIALALWAVHPSYASFLSGIMATIAIEIYMQVALFNSLKFAFGIIGGSLMLLSSILFTGLSLKLQEIRDSGIPKKNEISKDKEKKVFFTEDIIISLPIPAFLFVLSILSAGAGLLTVGFARF